MQNTLICENCGKTTERNSNRQRLCPDCRPKIYRVRATICERRRRKELGDAYRAYNRQIKAKPENREKQHKRQHDRWLKLKSDPVIMAKRHEKQIGYNDRALNKRDFGGNWYKVYDRDGGKCQVCNSPEKLCVHHKDGKGTGFPRERKNNSMENLVLLCNSCHMKIHRPDYNMKRKGDSN
jgi:hypothetical protein